MRPKAILTKDFATEVCEITVAVDFSPAAQLFRVLLYVALLRCGGETTFRRRLLFRQASNAASGITLDPLLEDRPKAVARSSYALNM